jgi:ABC-type sulfate/molybdate transport systems ATPase subunit
VLLRELDWEVRGGDFWVVLGLPGSGKSEVLETAAGLLPPATGSVAHFDVALTGTSTSQRAVLRTRVGFVFGDGGRLFSHLTVSQNLALPLCYQRDCPPEAVAAEVEQLLEWAELRPFSDWLPRRLNRTWRQRVALLRALILQPEVLFLDNPYLGLDPHHVQWWVEQLDRVLRLGAPPAPPLAAVVVAGDHFATWKGVATHGLLLHGGRARPVRLDEESMEALPLELQELLARGPAMR